MGLIGRIIKLQAVLYLLIAGGIAAIFAPLESGESPQLQTGDMLFQTSPFRQALAFILLSRSLYNHTGIYLEYEGRAFVLSVEDKVDFVPLETWLNKGVGQRYAVYRHREFSPTDVVPMMRAVKPFFKTPGDLLMQRGNPMLYSSEMVYDLFAVAGHSVGKVQTLEELAGRNRFTRAVAEQLQQVYPACMAGDKGFEACYDSILGHELITPASLAEGEQVEEIYSNYLGGLL